MEEKKEVLLDVKNLRVEYDTDAGVVYAVNGISFSDRKSVV